MSVTREPLTVDHNEREVVIPHIGVTMRIIIGAILKSWNRPYPIKKNRYRIVYKGATIGTINVRHYGDQPVMQH